jgi:hypothetical protein
MRSNANSIALWFSRLRALRKGCRVPRNRQFDLRSSGWWIVGSATACCENHLNLALISDPPVTQALPEVAFTPADVG